MVHSFHFSRTHYTSNGTSVRSRHTMWRNATLDRSGSSSVEITNQGVKPFGCLSMPLSDTGVEIAHHRLLFDKDNWISRTERCCPAQAENLIIRNKLFRHICAALAWFFFLLFRVQGFFVEKVDTFEKGETSIGSCLATFEIAGNLRPVQWGVEALMEVITAWSGWVTLSNLFLVNDSIIGTPVDHSRAFSVWMYANNMLKFFLLPITERTLENYFCLYFAYRTMCTITSILRGSNDWT